MTSSTTRNASANISPQAVIDPRAQIADDVVVGPYCTIGPHVEIGRGCHLMGNVTLTGRVVLGEENRLFPGAVIGAEPQDLSYRGGDSQVVIGDRNVIRESVTVNRATEKEDGVTRIGDDCYLMACSHIAHDCKLGNRVVIANATLLGGHVHIHDDATISGGVGVHHFSTIGSYSFVGGLSRVLHDVPPYMLVDGSPARPRCVNVVALKRNEFPIDVIKALSEAYRMLYRAKIGLDHARELLRSDAKLIPAVNHLLTFLQTQQEGRHGRARETRRAA